MEEDDCQKCGQWNVGGKEHECTTDVPLCASVPFEEYGFDLDELVFDIVRCDSGSGFGYRDYQFEMCSAPERRRVYEVLKDVNGIEFRFHGI